MNLSEKDLFIDRGLKQALKDLNLTAEQEQKIRDIQSLGRRDILNLRHEMQLAVFDIQEEYKKAKSDESKINACIDKLADAQRKIMKIRSSQMIKMKAVLTPEQFNKLAEKLDNGRAMPKKGFFDRMGQGHK